MSICMNNVTAQGDYRPLVEDGKTWIYNWYGSSETKDGEPLGHFTYRLDGDTVIGLQVCKKLFYSSSWDGTTDMYEGAFYEKDRQVFYFRPDSIEAQLFYDFNLGIGDQFIYEWGNATVRVDTPVFINAMVPFSCHDGRQQVAYSLCPDQYREFTPYGEGWGLMIEGIGSYWGKILIE